LRPTVLDGENRSSGVHVLLVVRTDWPSQRLGRSSGVGLCTASKIDLESTAGARVLAPGDNEAV